MWIIKWFVLLCFILVNTVISANLSDVPNYCPPLYNETKPCRLRTNIYTKSYWNLWAGYTCYVYTNTDRFYIKYNVSGMTTHCSITNVTQDIPYLVVNNEMILFDYTHEASLEKMKKLFIRDELFEIYLECCKEAEQACDNIMNESNVKYNSTHCPVVWDGWDWFPQTPIGTTAQKTCTLQAYSSKDKVCKLDAYSKKSCIFNTTLNHIQWVEKTDYLDCAIAPVYRRRHKYNVITLYIAIVLSLPAVIIFFIFRNLRKKLRITLHRNLLLVIVIRNILTIMSKELLLIDELLPDGNKNMSKNGVPCRILTFFENAFKNGIYASMLVDGFYLHKMIVRSFANEPNPWVLHGFALAVSIIPSLIWATVKGATGVEYCWLVDSNNEQWIVDGFRIVILTINTVLLIDIIRVMFVKMSQKDASRTTKHAFKATLFLIPLFGLHIIVTADKQMVYDDSCLAEDIYEYARYTMEALQGISVATLFCYFNAEVHNEIRNGYRKLSWQVYNKTGWEFFRPRRNNRRETTATYVQGGVLD